MKIAFGLIVTLMVASAAMGQVSCSPSVNKDTCSSVADSVNFILDHGVLHGVGIPMEIVTPAEYSKRLADTKEMEKRELGFAGGLDKAATHQEQFSPYYRHTLSNLWSENTTFFRDKPASRYVSAILVSSAQFDGIETYTLPGGGTGVRPNSHFDNSTISPFASFIGGYLAGTMGTMWDGSITADYLSNSGKH